MVSLVLMLMAIVLGGIAEAGTITIDFGAPVTITTTAAQDAAIQKLVDRVNSERASQDPPLPALTREQWIRGVMAQAIQSYRDQAAHIDAIEACVVFKSLTVAQQTALISALGGKSPCP